MQVASLSFITSYYDTNLMYDRSVYIGDFTQLQLVLSASLINLAFSGVSALFKSQTKSVDDLNVLYAS